MAASEGRTILLAIDASDNSKQAFDWLVKNIYKAGDHIIACHIPEAPKLPSFSFKDGLALPSAEWQKSLQEQIKKTEVLQNEYATELIKQKIPYKIVGEHEKNAGHGIILNATKEKADLIAMGTRGLDPIRRTFVGSVSDYVIHHSSIPVIVIPKTQK